MIRETVIASRNSDGHEHEMRKLLFESLFRQPFTERAPSPTMPR